MILKREFFERPVLKVAPDLLGKVLVRQYDKEALRQAQGKKVVGIITEVEAYDGFRDKASHASRGMTERNKIMFGPAGYFYVYFTYGMHWMLNVVTGDEGYPAAVLIRGIQCLLTKRVNIDGPGKLTKFLHIDKKLNGEPAFAPGRGASAGEGKLWFEDRGIIISKSKIERTPRIGVHYAEEWAEKPYRFLVKTQGLGLKT